MNQTILDHQKYLLKTYPFRGLNIIKGRGNYLVDFSGAKYLDLVTGFGVNIFGHSHPHIIRQLTKQLSSLTTLHGSFANTQRSKAAKRLSNRLGGKYAIYFGNSGTEAVEAALKFSILATGRSRFVSCHGAYHGKSLATLAVNGQEKHTVNYRKILSKARFLDYHKPQAALNHIDNQVAAVIAEPIQGEAGIRLPAPDFLQSLSQTCQKTGSLLIVDEIQTGLGRTGHFFAFEPSHIQPDIICLGKGLGGGIPVSATLIHKKHAAKIPRGAHTSTTGGNPLACAGINAVFDLLTAQVLTSNHQLGDYFLDRLKEQLADNPHVIDIRGRGLMLGVQLDTDPTPILKSLQQQGILAAPAGDTVIRFLPPFTITKQEINHSISVLSNVLATAS